MEQNENCSMQLMENSTRDCTPGLVPIRMRYINESAFEIEFLSEGIYELSIGDGNLQSLLFPSCGFVITGEYLPYLLWMCDFIPICLQSSSSIVLLLAVERIGALYSCLQQ